MAVQPKGTVTLLFSDIEGSTSMLERLGTERYAEVLQVHRRLLRDAFDLYEGYEVDEEGDAFLVAFGRAGDAVAAAAAGQQSLANAMWPAGVDLRVRMGVHTGEPQAVPPKYVGMDVHRAARIMSAAHGGQVLVSETTAALLERVALRDLGSHRLKDLLEPVRLYQLELEGLPGDFPALRSLHRTNLPIAAWPLLGREQELKEIRSLMLDSGRLVTLTGPGGSGKTRLALQAAAELSDQFADGVFFVALAPLRATSAVPGTVAEAIGLQPDDDVPAWLAERRVLLVLDNLEHLRGIDAAVGELLVGENRILATSRMPLRLAAEREVPVEPLADEAAMELFVTRAAAAGRAVEADETVASVCRRLDNLPLALELAAARSKLLAPLTLLQRLDASLPLLTGGASDRPERQRTLRATIEWSYDLLDPEDKEAFRRLSVFRSSFTLDAAEAVAGADLDLVAALLDQSLLKTLGDERFFMLETLREYARERLDEAGETDDYALRHARYYLDLLERNHPQRMRDTARRRELLAWYAAEEDDLRAMIDRLRQAAPVEAARAVGLLHSYWSGRGAYGEEREQVRGLLAEPELPDRSRADLLVCLAMVEGRLGNDAAAVAAGREALSLSRPEDESRWIASAVLAQSALGRREIDEAVRLGRQCVEAAEAAAEAGTLTETSRLSALANLASILVGAGYFEEARAEFHRAVDQASNGGHLYLARIFEADLAWIDLFEHNYEAAHAGFESVRTQLRHDDDYTLKVGTLRGIGLVALGLGQLDDARSAFSEMLDVALEANERLHPDLVAAASGIALAADPPDANQAARLRGALAQLSRSAHLEELGQRQFEVLESYFEKRLTDALGTEAWEQEKAAGARLSLDETIQLARSLAGSRARTPPTAGADPHQAMVGER